MPTLSPKKSEPMPMTEVIRLHLDVSPRWQLVACRTEENTLAYAMNNLETGESNPISTNGQPLAVVLYEYWKELVFTRHMAAALDWDTDASPEQIPGIPDDSEAAAIETMVFMLTHERCALRARRTGFTYARYYATNIGEQTYTIECAQRLYPSGTPIVEETWLIQNSPYQYSQRHIASKTYTAVGDWSTLESILAEYGDKIKASAVFL